MNFDNIQNVYNMKQNHNNLDNKKGLNLVKNSINMFKNELAKFANNPYHSLKQISKIQNNLQKIEETIKKEEQNVKFENINIFKPDTNINKSIFLPVLQRFNNDSNSNNSAINELDLNSNGSNFNRSKEPSNRLFHIRKKNEENQKNKVRRNMQFEKMTNDSLIKKYGLNKNDEIINIRNRSFSLKNFAIKGRTSAHPLFRKVDYSNLNKPILIPEDFRGGLYEMINRGLIPKNTDLTMAFSKNGNPFKFDPSILNTTKTNNDVGLDSTYKSNLTSKILIDFKDNTSNLFLTNTQTQVQNTKNQGLYNTDNKNLENINSTKIKFNEDINNDMEEMKITETSGKEKYRITGESNKENTKSNVQEILENFIIQIKNNKINENITCNQFKKKYQQHLQLINFYFNLIEKLTKSLKISSTEIDGNKLIKICKNELKPTSKMDLILCLTDNEIKIRGLNKPSKLFSSIRDYSATLINKISRGYLFRKNFKIRRNHFKKICRIQNFYRLYRILNISKSLVQDKLNNNMQVWQNMMIEFKENWGVIKQSKRIEIHINSLSFTSDVNCTIWKYTEKENNQMTRLISLIDENVEIIYLSAFKIPEDVINYYFSILATIGIKNIKERVHFIVPDTVGFLPLNFSLSSLIFYSTSCCKTIMNLIQGKYAYIIPGTPSSTDLRLSLYLECPILHVENEAASVLFSKSGAKRVFEVCDLATPISEWDLKSKDDIYAKLSNLIVSYSSIDIWILKHDYEFNGRGIAFLQISKSKHLLEARKDYMNNVLNEEKYKMQVENILRMTLHMKIEVIYKTLHKSGDDFINELIRSGGVIEACPTFMISNIIGSPTISFFIEPDGKISNIISFDKVVVNSFIGVGATSPQISIQNLVRFF